MFSLDTLQITSEVLNLIAESMSSRATWRALGTLAPERLRALRHVATIESIGSSTRIEGSKLSDREVERLLSNLEIGSFASRDEQEVAGYAEVMETVFQRVGRPARSPRITSSSSIGISFATAGRTPGIGASTRSCQTVSRPSMSREGRSGLSSRPLHRSIRPKLMTELVAWFSQARKAQAASSLAADRRLSPLSSLKFILSRTAMAA